MLNRVHFQRWREVFAGIHGIACAFKTPSMRDELVRYFVLLSHHRENRLYGENSILNRNMSEQVA